MKSICIEVIDAEKPLTSANARVLVDGKFIPGVVSVNVDGEGGGHLIIRVEHALYTEDGFIVHNGKQFMTEVITNER